MVKQFESFRKNLIFFWYRDIFIETKVAEPIFLCQYLDVLSKSLKKNNTFLNIFLSVSRYFVFHVHYIDFKQEKYSIYMWPKFLA